MMPYVETYGDASAANLVLIHGWGMHGGVWQSVVEPLSQHFHVHLVDLPGMGFSQPLPGQSKDSAAWLDAIIDSLIPVLPQHANICGWSFGGQLAMQLALRYPEQVGKLVLMGTTPKFVNSASKHNTASHTEPLDLESLAISQVSHTVNHAPLKDAHADWPYGMEASVFRQFAGSVSEDYRSTLLKFLTLQCMRSNDARDTIKQLRHSFEQRPAPDLHSLQQGLNSLLDNDFRAGVSSLRQPVLVLHGDKDTLAPVQAGYWLAEHLPDAQAQVIAGASHAPFLSHSALFIDALVKFLKPYELASFARANTNIGLHKIEAAE